MNASSSSIRLATSYASPASPPNQFWYWQHSLPILIFNGTETVVDEHTAKNSLVSPVHHGNTLNKHVYVNSCVCAETFLPHVEILQTKYDFGKLILGISKYQLTISLKKSKLTLQANHESSMSHTSHILDAEYWSDNYFRLACLYLLAFSLTFSCN